jgi:hypothetical protein
MIPISGLNPNSKNFGFRILNPNTRQPERSSPAKTQEESEGEAMTAPIPQRVPNGRRR